MSRGAKIALIAAASLAGLVALAAGAALIAVRTSWFHELVRQRIVQEIENSTGGRTEIGAFSFDWRRLEANVSRFTLHGTEPGGEAPLAQVKSIVVGLKIVSVFERKVDIALLEVRDPQIHVMVFPDGRTNLPEPKVARKNRKKPLETVLDLAVRRFAIEGGTVDFASRKTPFSAAGRNLRALFYYEAAGPRYAGNVSIQPLHVESERTAPIDLDVKIPVVIEQDRISFDNATVATRNSRLELRGNVQDMESPRCAFQLNGVVALADLCRTAKLSKPIGRGVKELKIAAAGSLAGNRLEIGSAIVGAGRSRVEFAGRFDDLESAKGVFRYQATVVLDEVGRTLDVSVLQGGSANLAGQAKLDGFEHYSLDGNLAASGLSFHKGSITVAGVAATARMRMDPARIGLTDLRATSFGGEFRGTATLERFREFRFEGDVHGMSAERIAGMLPRQAPKLQGLISGPVHGGGRLTPEGVEGFGASGDMVIAPEVGAKAPLAGKVTVTYNQDQDTVDLGDSILTFPHSRVEFKGVLGRRLAVHLVSRDPADFLSALGLLSPRAPATLPVSLASGRAEFDGTVTGKAEDPQISGHLTATNAVFENRKFDRVAADVKASAAGVAIENGNVSGRTLGARFSGSLGLRQWSPDPAEPLALHVAIERAELADLVAMAGKSLPGGSGSVSASVQVSGIYGEPAAQGEVTVAKTAIYGEAVDRVQAKFAYAKTVLEVSSAEIAAGAARVNLSGSYQHLPDNLEQGRAQFHVASNQIRVEELARVAKDYPDLTGTAQFTADGVADIRKADVRPISLNASLAGTGLRLNNQSLGSFSVTAATKGGVLNFQMKSDFASANITGGGEIRMEGDYPVTAQVSFAPLTYSSVRKWLTPSQAGAPSAFDAVAEGKLMVEGPVLRPESMIGTLQLSKLQVRTLPEEQGGPMEREITFSNAQPITLKLERSLIRIENARLVGQSTDLTVTGTASLSEISDVHVKGVMGMKILETFDPDVVASGTLTLDATVRGKFTNPDVTGRLDVKDAAFSLSEFPNGLSKANGSIVFRGSSAVIQQISAETGGGKVDITGFAGLTAGQLNFHLDARAQDVRVRYPEGVSTVHSANLSLTGTHSASLLSGNIAIHKVTFIPRTDFGAILARTMAPVPARATTGGFLEGMRLDVQIATSANASFESAIAQGVSANASLHVTGFGTNPAMLGRVLVTQGQITFFGNDYTINQGSVSFFNPVRMDPILNIDLETQTQGVDVTLTVSGSMRQLNISYRSDPPLPFSQIVSLLATGSAANTDPALVTRQTAAAPQGFQQMGESALLANAIGNPVASRLQKFFGITRLQVAPTVSGVENNPLASVILQQQISRNVTFTYIADVRQSNPQVVRIEWSIDPTWSAVATRDINGNFGLDFLYKLRFK